MNETSLRWKGRIGSLKVGCAIVLIIAAVLACAGISSLSTAVKNPGDPQPVTISQLVKGEVDTGTYVSVDGVAVYDVGYTKTENGKTTETYYFLIDLNADEMVLVKHYTSYLIAPTSGVASITGMTRGMPTDLKSKVEEDTATFRAQGFTTTTQLYLADGQSPPGFGSSLLLLIIGGVVIVLSIVPFFFPGTVFAPHPLDTTAPVSEGRVPVKATGKFQQLTSLDPLQIGKRIQNFTNAIANIIPMAEHKLMIYIHHILKTKTYGITVRTTVTDWGIFLDESNVRSVEAGKLYSWKDKWAVRFRYMGPKEKEETLYLVFANAGDQASCAKLLQSLGFQVSTYSAETV